MLTTRTLAAPAPGASGDIVLGQSAVLSGPLGGPLKAFNSAAQLAFDQVNRGGGIGGRQIRLVSLDDQLDPAKAVANCKTLLAEHKALAFFGGVGAATIAATIPLLRETRVPLIGNYAVPDTVREAARGAAYFVRATYRREAESLIDLLDVIGHTRIAVVHLANPGGDDVLARLRAAIRKHNPANDVVASAAVKNEGGGAAEAARTIAAARPQAVILFISGPPVVEFLNTLLTLGPMPTVYGMSIVAGDWVARQFGERLKGLSVVQVVPYPWAEVAPAAVAYREVCQAANQEVSYAGFEGWINAQVMIEALRRAGSDLGREQLHATMRGMKVRVAEMEVDFTGNSATGGHFVELVHVRTNGRFVR
jgi:ABC-type branched-subunit amino acid transport system substrate-binding protein